ncbi:serine hydrolase [Streptomyces sp. NPDC020807]|uniref:D-alanyl-D-alanine carboxypeptidase family protein n=1 Tax=Streptomyces sp. NPDC020807 TaxID=3155119 RepID=UPI0033C22BDE
MTHGGGTVAGESPDRAEQQGSSDETTASGGGTSSSSVQVDQPTAVFKTLAPRASDDAPKRESEGGKPEGGDPEPEGERLKAAVAAWVASAADEEPAPADGEPEEGEEPEEAPDADEAAEDPDEESAHDAEEADREAEGDADEEPVEDAAGTAVAAADATGEKASAAESWFAARKPSAGAAESSAPAAVPAAAADAEAKSEPEPESAHRPEPESAPRPEADSASDSVVDDTRDDEPVDQPTAMFKIVRPPAEPVVDQPTTALKLPADLRAPESDSERTSTFVPLRPDIPAERKAEQAAQAAQAAQAGQGQAAQAAQAGQGQAAQAAQAGRPQAYRAPKSPEAPKTARAPQGPPAPEARKAPAPAPVPPAQQAASSASPASPAGPGVPGSPAEAERTRQQPLPPLPPLDLLAELTNTPPPKPNALRTTLRRIRIWTPLLVLLLIIFAIVQMVRPLPEPVLSLTASPTYTFEGGELAMPWPTEGQGAVEVEGVGSMGLYGPQKPAPIASVTKTMTAYVILRDHPIKGKEQGPEITIDKKAADQAKATHESTAQVKEGQTYTEKELLELLMIPSANNVARLLARWDAGSEAAFVEKMNAAAKDLGMTQSTYTDPSGLLDTTMSTPQDQLKLAKAVMQYDVFREIVNMPNMTVDGIEGRIENNNNILLEPGVSGIKTGSSTPAGGNLLWSANTVVDGQNRRILGIVMGAKDAKLLNDKLQLAIDNSLKLIQQAQKDVTSAAVVKKDQVLGYVDDGLGGRTPVVATKELKAIGWPGLQVKLDLTDGGRAVPHTGKAGDVVGTVSIGEGAGRVSAPVALQKDLVEPGFDKKLTRVG